MIQAFVYRAHVADYQRLQPAFRTQSPQSLVARTLRPARAAQTVYQIAEGRGIPLVEDAFFRAHAKYKLLSAAERPGLVTDARPREFQPVPPERNFSRGEHSHAELRQQSQHLENRIRKAPGRRAFIRTARKSGGDASMISEINLGERVMALVKFIQLPFGRARCR